MKLLYEKLYFYYVALKTKFIDFDAYKKWLNKVFLETNTLDDFFLELQLCTHSLEKTIKELHIYLYDKTKLIDYHFVMKMIIKELEQQYDDKMTLYEKTKKLYEIWCLLPEEISDGYPFLILNSIDDPWAWGGEDEVIKIIDNLINYYK